MHKSRVRLGCEARYSKKELEKKGVEYQKEQSGTKKEMHKWQTRKSKSTKIKMVGIDQL